MDKPPLPTAAELGLSEADYARILRDVLRRKGDLAPFADPPAEVLDGLLAGPQHDPGPLPPERRARRSKLGGLALLGLVAAVAVLPRWGAIGSEDHEPAYAFLRMNGEEPVTYTSCRPIFVAVYPAGGPPDAEQLVREAVAQMRTATGLDIVVTGSFGGHAPNWGFGPAPVHPDDPISVSWQDGDAIAELTDHIAGLGGSRTVASPRGGERRVAGTIALSRHHYADLHERGEHDQALAILLHEFGHVFGLDHVDAPGELMHEDNIGRTTFGPGDLEGLRRLGQGPCV